MTDTAKKAPVTKARLNWNSWHVTQGDERAPNRAMLRAVGFGDGDFEKPIIGVAHAQSNITPCNNGLGELAGHITDAIREGGGMPQVYGTITVSDGISMGTEGMKCSLVSREVIADSIETVSRGQSHDGVIVVGGCDKNMPGAMIGIARLNIPAIFVYGGTIKPGNHNGTDLTIVSVFEAVGSFGAGKITREEFEQVEKKACPGNGSCGGMYTANTMSSAFEAMGMSLPYSSTMSAIDAEKATSSADSARALLHMIEHDIRPLDILTKEAFENAITVIMAVGGSTNAVLHLMAIAHAANIPLGLEDFERIREATPVFCDLKPSGRYVATDLHDVGGIPRVMKMLLRAGLLHGDCLTVTGKTIAENLAEEPDAPDAGQDVIHEYSNPLYVQGHLAILRGNLAPEGSVAKISGLKSIKITGPARVFESEEESMHAIMGGGDQPRRRAGDSLRGAEGRAGHARDAVAHFRHHRQGPGRQRGADH